MAELEINHASSLHISRESGERRASQSNRVDLLEKYMITHTSEEALNAFFFFVPFSRACAVGVTPTTSSAASDP